MGIFYEKYVRLCNKVEKSPSGVALEIGLSKTAVNGWKHGRSNPTDATIQRIADYFGISAQELMSENENKPAPANGNELDIQKLVNSMDREQLVDFIVAASARLRDME